MRSAGLATSDKILAMIVWLRHFLGWLRSVSCAREDLILENLALLSSCWLSTLNGLVGDSTVRCGTAGERLAHVLVSLASGIGKKVAGGVELKIRNDELANEANVTPFTASRLLSQWQRRGMLLKSRGKILVRSPELLLRHAA